MRANAVTMLEMSRLEAAHLTDLLAQFIDLLAGSGTGSPTDPAVARLVPDAYADDPEASMQFRGVTEHDLLARRAADARTMLDTLTVDGARPEPATAAHDVTATALVALDVEGIRAWLRTLTALRLVLASRLGIRTEEDHDHDDPRFGIYDWLGYRLDGLINAADQA